MILTLDQLRRIMPGCPAERAELIYPHLMAAMEQWKIDSPLRIAAFLAQLGHESLDLKYMQEIASGAAYDRRADLGNTKPEAIAAAKRAGTTPGRFYKGHGPIQITGYDNHLACGKALGIDAVNEPWRLAEPKYGFQAAGWFWGVRGLNKYADLGLAPTEFKRVVKRRAVIEIHPAFDIVSFRVNGTKTGTDGRATCNGIEDRRRRYAVAIDVLLHDLTMEVTKA